MSPGFAGGCVCGAKVIAKRALDAGCGPSRRSEMSLVRTTDDMGPLGGSEHETRVVGSRSAAVGLKSRIRLPRQPHGSPCIPRDSASLISASTTQVQVLAHPREIEYPPSMQAFADGYGSCAPNRPQRVRSSGNPSIQLRSHAPARRQLKHPVAVCETYTQAFARPHPPPP